MATLSTPAVLAFRSVHEFGVRADAEGLQTEAIQRAIDACAAAGEGLSFPAGTYRSGTLLLRSHLALRLEEGAVLLGSDKIADYDTKLCGGGFLISQDLQDIRVEGPGVIDGADCADPNGEEGFRGPHCLAFTRCKDVRITGLTIRRSANWAFNFVECSDVAFDKLTILAGHDGVDAMNSRGFRFSHCDFRTGDDCIAGNGNQDFHFIDCAFNSSCNGMRLSCIDLLVDRCRFYGPGQYAHKITGHNKMLAAFVHFSPPDRAGCAGPQPQSDRWLIANSTVENANQLYEFDYRTLWQNGRPAGHVTFRDVTATGLTRPITVCGDGGRQFRLTLERVTLALPRGTWFHHPFVDLRTFDALEIRGLTCIGVDGSHMAISTVDGRRVDVQAMECKTSA